MAMWVEVMGTRSSPKCLYKAAGDITRPKKDGEKIFALVFNDDGIIYWSIGLAGLLVGAVTVLPLFMIAEGVRQLGAERAALVSTIGPPTTIVMAWIVLGEVLAPMQLLGAAAVITGILVLEGRGLRGIRWKRKGEGAR